MIVQETAAYNKFAFKYTAVHILRDLLRLKLPVVILILKIILALVFSKNTTCCNKRIFSELLLFVNLDIHVFYAAILLMYFIIHIENFAFKSMLEFETKK